MTSYTHTTLYTGDDIAINGVTLNTISSDGCRWIVTDLDGWWGLPDVAGDDDPRPFTEDGSYSALLSYPSRNVTLTGYIVPGEENVGGPPFTVAARNALNQALHLVRDVGILWVNEMDEAKIAAVQVVARPLTVFTGENDALAFNIQLRAADPRKYAEEVETALLYLPDVVAGRRYNRKYVWNYQTSLSPKTVDVYNRGSAETYITAQIDGPVINPRISRLEDGAFIEFKTSIGNNESVLVDFRNKSAISTTGKSIKTTMTAGSSWFQLWHGDNTLQFEGTQGLSPQTGLVEATNLFTNPSFETTSGLQVVRVNLARNPNASKISSSAVDQPGWMATTSYGTGGAGSLVTSTSFVSTPLIGLYTFARKTWSTAASSTVGTGVDHTGGATSSVSTAGVPVLPGTVYTTSVWVRSTLAQPVYLQYYWHDPSGNTLLVSQGQQIVLTPNVWSKLTVSAIAPSGADTVGIATHVPSGGQNWTVGSTLDTTALLVEQTTLVRPFFSGSYTPHVRDNFCVNPSFETDTVNWSSITSTITRVTSGSGAPVKYGTASCRVQPLSISGSGLRYRLATYASPPGLVTASVWIYSAAPLDLSFSVEQINGSSVLIVSDTTDFSVPAGEWTRLSYTVNTPGTLFVGMAITELSGNSGGPWYVDGALIESTANLLPFFDGSSTPTEEIAGYTGAWYATVDNSPSFLYDADFTRAWTGTANSSTSSFSAAGVASAASYVISRTNLMSDPDAHISLQASGRAQWFPRGYGTGGAGGVTNASSTVNQPNPWVTNFMRLTWSTSASSNTGSGFIHTANYSTTGTFTSGLPVVAGTSYAFSNYVRATSSGTKNGAHIALVWRTAAGAYIGTTTGADAILPTTVWVPLSVVAIAPSNAAFVEIVTEVTGGTPWVVSDTLDGTMMLIEASPTVNPYFSGDYPDTGAIVYSWSSTPYQSTSLAAGTASFTISSTRWAKSRAKSARVISMQEDAPGQSTAILNFVPAANTTYTVIATLHMTEAQTGPVDPDQPDRRIKILGANAIIQSSQAPNAPGTYTLRLQWTTSSTAERVALFNGGIAGGADVWWDDVAIIQGSYDSGYFDGTMTPAVWLGTADASASYQPFREEVNNAVVQLAYRTAWIE